MWPIFMAWLMISSMCPINTALVCVCVCVCLKQYRAFFLLGEWCYLACMVMVLGLFGDGFCGFFVTVLMGWSDADHRGLVFGFGKGCGCKEMLRMICSVQGSGFSTGFRLDNRWVVGAIAGGLCLIWRLVAGSYRRGSLLSRWLSFLSN